MGKFRDLNIKNRTYYYFDDIIDIKKFESNLLKIYNKLHKDFDIYYIAYDMVTKFGDCNSICSVNHLYLIFHSATRYFKQEYGEKYLILDSNKKSKEVLSETKSEIITINGGKELFYEKDYAKLVLTLAMIYL